MKKILGEVGALARAVVVTVVVAFAGMSALSACGWLKSEGSAAGAALVDCAKADVTAGSLLSDVAAALASTDGWRAALDALAQKYGRDAVACAVRAADAVLSPRAPRAPRTSQPIPEAQRAAEYLGGVRFK